MTDVAEYERRMWAKTEVVDGHRLWRGANSARSGGVGKPRDDAHRYGLFTYEGRLRPAHVVSHLLFVGPVPDDWHVHHVCEVTLCWTPDHLQAVTPRHNLMASDTPARRNAAKTHCERAGHPLSGDNVRLKTLRGGRSIVRACRACELEVGNEWRAANRDRVNALRRAREGRPKPGDAALIAAPIVKP